MQDTTATRIRPVIIGITITILMLAGLAYIANQRRNVSTSPPALTIMAPTGGASVDSPLVVHFNSAEPLLLHPTGWGARDLHLHARINGIELMPSAADIEQRDTGYLWTMPAVGPGPTTLRLGWADAQHRELRTGASDTVSFIIR